MRYGCLILLECMGHFPSGASKTPTYREVLVAFDKPMGALIRKPLQNGMPEVLNTDGAEKAVRWSTPLHRFGPDSGNVCFRKQPYAQPRTPSVMSIIFLIKYHPFCHWGSLSSAWARHRFPVRRKSAADRPAHATDWQIAVRSAKRMETMSA